MEAVVGASEQRLETRIKQAVAASEQRLDARITEAVGASEQRLEARITEAVHTSEQRTRRAIRATRRHMRVLHEEVLDRISKLGEAGFR